MAFLVSGGVFGEGGSWRARGSGPGSVVGERSDTIQCDQLEVSSRLVRAWEAASAHLRPCKGAAARSDRPHFADRPLQPPEQQASRGEADF
ncbi:hypothetical protein BST65_32700 [Bradyrhizobium canariense]|nr:hypothetical protein BST65_32700 [Bradyrhizobium canariense]OSI33446.1 hypothetical protein BST66_13670 [Bradyrhizobium canariense]OSI39666.1 hypothetical protein BSZ20_29535 [Bradyrhizobium canariense]OSI47689.1 hypothetical protein BST67_20015 [Bradyrhizobium canariense]OSI56033.1 hypothetical protein BSZ15_18515 [Bradyrhizobium canariense]